MFRFLVLVFVGFVMLSVYAPDVAQDLMRRGRDAFVAFQQGNVTEPLRVDTPTKEKDNDAGGIVRIRSDYGGHYTTEYDLHLYLKRAEVLARSWGDAAWHRRQVADALGL